MSEQSDALHKKALEAGIISQQAPEQRERLEDEPERPQAPWVLLPGNGRLVSDFAREFGCLVTGKGLYRYKGMLVTVEKNEKTGRFEIEEMDSHGFRTWAERVGGVICYKLKFTSEGPVKIKETMGVEVATGVLRAMEFRKLQPVLLRINNVRVPIRRDDGAIELLPEGYDPESCTMTVPQGWEYDEEMSPADAAAVLNDLVREFPFEDERSRAVFFAALLSQFSFFLQPLDAKRINFLFHANSSGSGKTLLVEIILTIVWGYGAVDAMPDDTGKMQDRLDTAVREGAPYIVFDDLDQTFLRSGMLNAFMTASWWSGRKFHSQQTFTEPKTTVVFLTANNLDVSPDIARRTLTCDLFSPEADTQARQIQRPIDPQWLRQPTVHRQLCSALWALVKAWRDGDRQHKGRAVPGFQEWCSIYGAMTMAAGWEDPCGQRKTDGYGNSEYSDMLELISAMVADVKKTAEFEFSDVVNLCRERNCFANVIKGKLVKRHEAGEEWDEFVPTDETNSALGKILGRYGGKAFTVRDGRRVIFDRRGKNRHRRFVIEIAGAAEAAAS